MDQRKAFFWFGFLILVWTVFWNGAIRIIALRHDANSGGSAVSRGLMVLL